ncbi:MAG: M15 family metallopeptidase [Clostridiales bacterium]|nr:M15 family metallopeptidase [Clostridiales bacterium]
MNNHLQRLREEERIQRQKNKRSSKLVLTFVMFSFSLLCLIGVMATIDPLSEKKSSDSEGLSQTIRQTETDEAEEWRLLIISRDSYLPVDFTVDLKKVGDVRVDHRISDPLESMIEDADAAGIKLIPVSGYRSVSEQRVLYDDKKASFLQQGYGEEAAEIYTRELIQPPGASEHHTGLAIDFLTMGITELDEGFAQSPAYQWLRENAANYGFIERYPADKTEKTGVSWEPWHFRYVGTADAIAISSMAICLEEYK